MRTILFTAAAGLGLLAFFEPCTIATHTLFAVRASRDDPGHRWSSLIRLILLRSALLATLFGVAAWAGWENFSTHTAATLLAVFGAIYLISRKVYLPVPHIEFFRLLPGHGVFSQSSRLGLTLPACTLPLVTVIGALAAVVHEPGSGILAGIVFAGMFSLPTVWDSLWGASAANRQLLGKAADASPYLTALILWSGSLLTWQGGI